MIEVILIVMALVWLAAASILDLRTREIPNWLSFSLIVFALGFRFFYSLFEADSFSFFYQGLIGFGIFFVLGNLLYYARMFAGGDAKLMIALGTVLPLSESFLFNLETFGLFVLIFLFAGGVYGLVWSIVLSAGNFRSFRREFVRRLNSGRKFVYPVLIFGLLLMLAGFYEFLFFLLGVFVFVMPYFYLFAKAVDESCMVKKVASENLTEGDWLYKDVRVGKKVISAEWDGLNREEIKLLRKNKKDVLVRHGIPFVPVFLIGYLVLLYVYYIKI